MTFLSKKILIVYKRYDVSMDDVDKTLCLELAQNSRLPFRELADRLGLSVNSVHKRVRALTELGIITKFTANVSLTALNGIVVIISGKSETSNVDGTIEKLGKRTPTFKIVLAGGNYLYVFGLLRDVSEMRGYVSYVKREGNIVNPDVGIATPPPASTDFSLTKLDFRIIQALHDDSRRALSDVAEELGVSSRTVRRRLSRMEEDNSIVLSIDFVPTASSDILGLLHLTIRDSVDRSTAASRLKNEYSRNSLGIGVLDNVPDFLYFTVWTKTMKELKDIQTKLENEGMFESVVPNIFYNVYLFETWRDELLLESAGLRESS